MKNVTLYGSGRRCSHLLEYIQQGSITIQYIIDSNPSKWGSYIDGYRIYPPEVLQNVKNVPICITIADKTAAEEIRKSIKEKYGLINEICYFDLIRYAYQEMYRVRQCIEQKKTKDNARQTIIFDCYKGLVLGGIEEWTKGLCMQLSKSGETNVRILSDCGQYAIDKELESHIDKIDIDHYHLFEDSTIFNILKYLSSHLPCTIISSQPDIVLYVAGIIKYNLPDEIRIISVIHGGSERIYNNYMTYKEYIDEYVCVSQDIQQALIARGIPQEIVHSMTCPVECVERLERTYSEDSSKPIQVGYAGRIEIPQKRMDLMQKVIACLEDEKVNYHFNIAGDGLALNMLKEYVRENDLEGRVTFWGRIDRSEIYQFWQKQDIYVNVADYEGRSISQLEAMANGAVPIATRTSGTREDIMDDQNGYTVDIGDYEGISKKIKYLACHRERLKTMGRLAHDTVYPKCQTKAHTEFWNELLRRQEWILSQGQ
ncbi:MAG: glycosyltransferase [Lachnospiraceae bacterium]|nr:glycosyltransferase [Lachnospiraceae bacterium]